MALRVDDHRRDSAGLTYVYPVLSRRAGGISLGINLNPNHACNWRCIYCQVPGLVRGAAPEIDLDLLRRELDGFLSDYVAGRLPGLLLDDMSAPLMDVAFSGDGEPTSASAFPSALELVAASLSRFSLEAKTVIRLITNGSLMHRPSVQAAVRRLGELGGEVWFKVDRATESGLRQVNDTHDKPQRVAAHLGQCAALCPTWVQSCFFCIDGSAPAESEMAAYVDLLAGIGPAVKGVLLYGLARPSMQPEAVRLSALPDSDMENLANRLRLRGMPVRVVA